MVRMRWHRSLYWRTALGVVGFLAAMLVVQAMLFVWAVSQTGRTLPGQSPLRLASTVALDLANLLERDPRADVERYVHDQYAQYTHPFFVMLADGRVITSGSPSFPEPLLRMAREQLGRRLEHPERGADRWRFERQRGLDARDGPDRRERLDGQDAREGQERRDGPDRTDGQQRVDGPNRRDGLDGRAGLEGPRGRGGERFDLGPVERFERAAGGGPPFARPIPILVASRVAGLVVVPPQAPFGFLLRRYAPMLALVAGGVLVLGTVVTSLMIFGPARRRLRDVEAAARRLGSGDLTARAPERGGDEVAAVASAFNAMAADLAARADALAVSDRTRRQLLADVSHELTTPVTAIRGYLETLSMTELALDAATRDRYLSIISDETHRLERLIGDLLELARLEGGGGSLTRERVAVADLFDRIRARHEPACRAAGVLMESAMEPGADTLVGDRNRLEQALQNLAANAVRYAPRGSVVRLHARRAGSLAAAAGSGASGPSVPITLSIEDSGPGIPPEHLPHVFDRFYKADASRAGVSGGSGLGLSIVKAIVERHGGRITVASQPGRTVFEIVLPAEGASS
jgi:signal transduction histidine kinase